MRALALLALGAALAGCSFTGEYSVAIFADPGKYQYHNCEQLAAATTGLNIRQKDLTLLIDAAAQSAVGTALSVVAYRGEYRMNAEELVMIERQARSKNCTTAANWRSNAVIR
jgi:hypothetical protein